MSIREQIIEAVRTGAASTERQIAEELGYTQRQISLLLEKMERDGELASEFIRPTDSSGRCYSDGLDGTYHYSLA
jgi:predicted transcriptional regulator